MATGQGRPASTGDNLVGYVTVIVAAQSEKTGMKVFHGQVGAAGKQPGCFGDHHTRRTDIALS